MNTTFRWARGWALALPIALAATAAAAQLRAFPQNTLRGTIAFGDYPEIRLNGRAATLTPGSRVRDREGRIVMAGDLTGQRALVHYTLELGETQVRDVWILRPEEAAVRPWPRNLEEARTWTYDAETMTWIQP